MTTDLPPPGNSAGQQVDPETTLAVAVALWKKTGLWDSMAPEDARLYLSDLQRQLARTQQIKEQMISRGGNSVRLESRDGERAAITQAELRLVDSIHSMLATAELMRADDTSEKHRQLLDLHARAGAQATTELSALLAALDVFLRKDSEA